MEVQDVWITQVAADISHDAKDKPMMNAMKSSIQHLLS